jgi:hypothetical protein
LLLDPVIVELYDLIYACSICFYSIDRRKMTDPALHFQLLGGFSVRVNSVPIPEEQWRSRRVRSLVKLLALARVGPLCGG